MSCLGRKKPVQETKPSPPSSGSEFVTTPSPPAVPAALEPFPDAPVPARNEDIVSQVSLGSPSDVISPRNNMGGRSGYFGVNWEDPRQVMEGIGGSITWFGNWALAHPQKDAILDTVFNELKPSVLRLRNTFGQGGEGGGPPWQTSAEMMEESAIFVQEGRKRLTGKEAFRILMCSWSPPITLKASGVLNGAGSSAGEADTLKKDDYGVFLYKAFADYWLQSLRGYEKLGVLPSWISIQNEPEWSTPYHPVCAFRPAEDFFYPGYYRAFEEVYETLRSGLDRMPEMIGPECSGFDNFVTAPLNGRKSGFQASPYSGNPKVSAICNHLYDAGVRFSQQDFFKKLEETLRNVRREADETMTRRVFMTEFANLANEVYSDPLDLAKTIYYTLSIADAAMYLQWDLLWGRSNEGTMVLVDNPFNGGKPGFQRTQSFYWFQHFCRFIRPGMQRMGIKDKDSSLDGILILVFVSKVIDASSTVILINTTNELTRVECGFLPNFTAGRPRKVHYSTLDEKFTFAGLFQENTRQIWLKPSSITSLHSGDF